MKRITFTRLFKPVAVAAIAALPVFYGCGAQEEKTIDMSDQSMSNEEENADTLTIGGASNGKPGSGNAADTTTGKNQNNSSGGTPPQGQTEVDSTNRIDPDYGAQGDNN